MALKGRLIVLGVPPLGRQEVYRWFKNAGVEIVEQKYRGKWVADLIDHNTDCGRLPFDMIKGKAFLQLGATLARSGVGYFPDLDPTFLGMLSDTYPDLRFVLISASPETVVRTINESPGNLRQRLMSTDLPGFPAHLRHDEKNWHSWIENYHTTVRSRFGADRLLDINVDENPLLTEELADHAFEESSPEVKRLAACTLTIVQVSPRVARVSLTNVREAERSFMMNMRSESRGGEAAKDIGITSNEVLKHHPMWKSYLALNFASTFTARMYGKATEKIVVETDFPLDAAFVELFSHRIKGYGSDLEIRSDIIDRRYDFEPRGSVLSFGGGKESRLTYGNLREFGEDVTVVTTDTVTNHGPIDKLRKFNMHGTDNLEIRLLPAFMMQPSVWYFGGSMGEARKQKPWQYYYDFGAPAERKKLQKAFSRLGYDVNIKSPTTILPSNICQKILVERYPDVARHQASTPFDSLTEKTLFVYMLYMNHGLDASRIARPETLQKLLDLMMPSMRARDFGAGGAREPYRRETMAIIYYLLNMGLLKESLTGGDVPADWRGRWVNYIHEYIDFEVDERFMQVYKQYAPLSGKIDLDYRMPVEN